MVSGSISASGVWDHYCTYGLINTEKYHQVLGWKISDCFNMTMVKNYQNAGN